MACETCGKPQTDARGRTPGECLIAELRAGLAARPDAALEVGSVRCLWACARSCAVALRSPSRVGYVIAGLAPTGLSARALLDFAALYARSEDGAVPYKQWPAELKGHFLCRFPRTTAPAPEQAAVGEPALEQAASQEAAPQEVEPRSPECSEESSP